MLTLSIYKGCTVLWLMVKSLAAVHSYTQLKATIQYLGITDENKDKAGPSQYREGHLQGSLLPLVEGCPPYKCHSPERRRISTTARFTLGVMHWVLFFNLQNTSDVFLSVVRHSPVCKGLCRLETINFDYARPGMKVCPLPYKEMTKETALQWCWLMV